MIPTLKPGQDVLSINWFFKPKIGDIVVLKLGGKEMVKRVEKIEDQKVFVVGDNTMESTDSRDFGTVGTDKIVGKVVYQSERHPELVSGSNNEHGSPPKKMLKKIQHDECVVGKIPCPQCFSPMIGIYGRKDAICSNCGFKLVCCGE